MEQYFHLKAALQAKHKFINCLDSATLAATLNGCGSYVLLREKYERILLALSKEYTNYAQPENIVDVISAYIRKNYCADLSLKSLSEVFYMSPTYLSAHFNEKGGVTISNYIKMIRLNKAIELLTGTNTAINCIAKMVGYPNYRYFCSLFKKEHGLTPMGYRMAYKLNCDVSTQIE